VLVEGLGVEVGREWGVGEGQEAGGWRLEAGGWRLEAGGGKREAAKMRGLGGGSGRDGSVWGWVAEKGYWLELG
jgi:hypothetical protein